MPGKGFERFADALCAEISCRSDEIAASCRCCNFVCDPAGQPVPETAAGKGGRSCSRGNTLYIGGGTPSVLPLHDMERIVSAVAGAAFGASAAVLHDGGRYFDEFTVEVNPDDIVSRGAGYVEGLAALGVNRISMGVQAMDDRVLKWMNRRHDVETARAAYRIIRSAGIGNIGIDLIFGYNLPEIDNSLEHWKKTVETALDIAGDGAVPKHVSAYQLSVDDGSALAEMAASGKYRDAPGEICAMQYRTLCGLLAAAGYRHYEISNFAQPGYEAIHNSAYWSHVPYVGLGPAAHSFSGVPEDMDASLPALRADEGGDGDARPVRKWNKADAGAYLKAAGTCGWSGIVCSETLDNEQVREEKIMLSLRTDKGISRKYLEMDETVRPAVEKYLASGALVPVDAGTLGYYGFPAGEERLRIPEDRFFVSDDIISGLL